MPFIAQLWPQKQASTFPTYPPQLASTPSLLPQMWTQNHDITPQPPFAIEPTHPPNNKINMPYM